MTSTFIGHIYAHVSVTANTGASITGQLLANTGAVTLDGNTIVNDNCTTPSPTPTPTPTTPPCTAVISNLLYTTGGIGTTVGRLTWTTTGSGLFQYVGDSSLYPAPYNYGTLTSSWNGSLVNLLPGTNYPVAVKFVATCGTVSQVSTTASNGAAVATPTPTPTPVVTPTPTPVVTPTPTPTPVVTSTPTPTPVVTPTPTPPATDVGGQLPKTSSPWYNLLVLSAGLILLGSFAVFARKLKRN